MKKRFRKVYVEITNICNLKCSFCPGNERFKDEMSLENFKFILDRLEDYTDSLYFHLMGEPLVHSKINEFIDLASLKYRVNITTNGYLIKKIEDNKNIHRVNISLQAIKSEEEVDKYLENIFKSVEKLRSVGTVVVYRIWNEQVMMDRVLKKIETYYQVSLKNNNRIKDNVYLDRDIPFIWPDLGNSYYQMNGSCMGLRSHIGILVNGDIVPCCLDYNGALRLGNIYQDDLNKVLESKMATEMVEGFKKKKKCEELCRHCNFYDRIVTKLGDKDEK